MRINSADFLTSATNLEQCPQGEMAEFAFIGRSNVGKSSLINMLTQRDGLARVSKTPGHTQLINFFEINKRWMLVDLPGYGYAKRSAKSQAGYQEMVSEYLSQREQLSCVFLLIDSRIKPQEIDLQFMEWLIESEIPFVVVFTKTEKVKAKALADNIELFNTEISEFCEFFPRMYKTSSKDRKKTGRTEILGFIEEALKNAETQF